MSWDRGSLAKASDAGKDLISRLDPDEGLGLLVVNLEVEANGVLQFARAAMRAAPDLLLGQRCEPAFSQANAKLVYRTVLTVDDPEETRHVVPLKLRKAANPLYRKVQRV